jgi:tetratricopeptide (TPR) repeat protein
MKKAIYHNAIIGHVLITALGSTMLVLLILVSFVGAGPFADISKSGSNNVSNLNKSDEAIKSYDNAIEINPQRSEAWSNKGLVLYHLNKSDEAITAFDKAIEINPRDSDAWKNTGATLGNLNRYEEAVKAYDKAIEINPQDSDAWYNKGITLAKLGKFDEAIKAYDKATEINPQLRSLVQ